MAGHSGLYLLELGVGRVRHAAARPEALNIEDVDSSALDRERSVLADQARSVLADQARASGKPEEIVQKMVDGQISKWMKEVVLLDQPWVKDDKKTIGDLQQELVAKIGENIQVRRFVRFELGEGLEKKQDDFAKEVAEAAGLA